MPKNPFRIKEMRGLWDLLFHNPPFTKEGVRSVGNSLHDAFWNGYDDVSCCHIPKDSWAWACYRAGRDRKRLDCLKFKTIQKES
jgi:hypothetical protein